MATVGTARLRITVVVPARDEERLLPRLLASLAAQDRPADEVVVVDNGSTDRTAELARAAGARVVVEPVPGVWPAAAAGYDAATGDVVARCDADCVLPPGWLAALERALLDDPAALAVTGPGVFAGLPRPLRMAADVLYMRAYFVAAGAALGGVPLFGSSLGLRRSAWRAVRDEVHRDADVHDDLDLSFHLPPGSTRYVPGMAVEVHHRPFTSVRALVRRYRRGWRSVMLHWPGRAPWVEPQRRARAAPGRSPGRTR
ncbi:glycosyltransferase family 2 protein [Cellulomonas endophytica]|uniref:glycosyltransferase family 2 protein n=1 Tax=Cellulomonas endophytica TaxID=2494735 RepID=UPI00196B8F8A|nr:glycosyltransferase family 2 protein [Cellulomonas endophytica]